jgi:hypothetical protein
MSSFNAPFHKNSNSQCYKYDTIFVQEYSTEYSNFEKKNLWSNVPDMGLTPRHTDWLTDRQSQCDFDFDKSSVDHYILSKCEFSNGVLK